MILTMVVTSDLWVSSKANESRHGYMKLSGVSCATRNFHSFFFAPHSFIHSFMRSSSRLFIHQCMHARVRPFIHSSVHEFDRPSPVVMSYSSSGSVVSKENSLVPLFFFSSEKILPSFTRLWSKSLKFEIFRRYCHCLYCYCCFCCCCCCCCRHVMFTTSSF